MGSSKIFLSCYVRFKEKIPRYKNEFKIFAHFLSVFNLTVDAAGQMQKEFQGKGFKWKTLLSIDILGLTPNRVILMFQSVPKYEI